MRDHPPRLEGWGGTFDPTSTPEEHSIVGALAESFGAVTGTAATLEGMTYGADMRLLVNVV
jgi:acetylornithine deacetylase